MKKLLLAGIVASTFNVFAQINTSVNTQQRTCGTEVLPPEYETWVQSLVTSNPGKYGNATTQSVFNIPVVVHIIHNNEPVNSISATSGNNLNAAQVVDQINILNKDFNGTNSDTNLIPAVFKPLLGKFQINFCLAVVNPTGGIMPEPGIDRINRVSKGWNAPPYSSTYASNTIKPNSIWDPNKYLNIWVSALSGGLLGFATFPNPATSGIQGLSSPFGSATSDGVVILNTAFGSIGTGQFGQYNKGRTVTHEVGHWIGLRHIWGDGNCATDYCADTPPAQNANYNCPNFPYKLGTCAGNTTGEMTMNYMDYTNDACMYMFTMDQKNRAQLILTHSPIRAALITSTVCNLPTVTNDIGITFVSQPTYSQVINCQNYIDPVVSITNYGSNTLTSALFTFNVDGVNTQTLTWNGNLAPNSSVTVALTQIGGLATGVHTFSVNVTSPNGGADNNLINNDNQQIFSVTNNMPFNVTSAVTCVGAPVVLTASSASNYSYTWSTGANTSTVSVSPSLTTVYTVTATSISCSSSKTVTVTVQTTPVITLNKTSICEGVPTLVTALGAVSYTWNTGATSSSLLMNLSAPTNFTVSGSTSGGCIGTATLAVAVNPAPTSITTVTFASCSSCSDGAVSVNPTGGTAPYSYSWSPVAGNASSLSNLAVGCYDVKITDALGCSSTNSICVSFGTGVSKSHLGNTGITLLPNPTKGEFVIKFPANGIKKIQIIDALGRTVKNEETTAASVTIDISSFAGGVYYAKINSEDNLSVVKFIKE